VIIDTDLAARYDQQFVSQMLETVLAQADR
jgi:hypothetical protein